MSGQGVSEDHQPTGPAGSGWRHNLCPERMFRPHHEQGRSAGSARQLTFYTPIEYEPTYHTAY